MASPKKPGKSDADLPEIHPKEARKLREGVVRPSSGAMKSIDAKTASNYFRSVKPKSIEETEDEDLEMLQYDLQAARDVQAKLLPETVPRIPGYDFGAFYSTAVAVGGDFYDFIQFDKNTLGLLVADASGKGMAGSLLMVEARAVIRSMASLSSSPKQILANANRVLLQDLRKGMFITLFYAVLDLSKGIVKMASAGHMPMLLWRWKSKKCFAVNPPGLVLGAATEEMFNDTVKEHSVELEPGDRLVLYTDGVTELMDSKDNEYGRARFVKYTLQNANRPSVEYVQGLVADLDAHRAGFAQSDDITILTVRSYPEDQMW
jgi:sigma-B regulation protein RsbU (phosphoserine phosphatase)